jgi:ubiquinone/menaquinone biosynthesis C-methylase UbiE
MAMQLADVGRNYDWAAPRYDRWTDLIFGRLLGVERYRERTIDLLGALEGATVLDVGCGTGRNFPILAPRVGARGRIIGVDYSEGMLALARRRAETQGWTNVELLRGDAARLEGVPAGVDAVVSVWCLGIVHDLGAALGRILDLLAPGGRFAVMDFRRSRPSHGPLHWLYPLYRPILVRSGIDSPEDLDDAALQQRWQRGTRLLRDRLTGVSEETYLYDGGFILAGEKPVPAGADRAEGRRP